MIETFNTKNGQNLIIKKTIQEIKVKESIFD